MNISVPPITPVVKRRFAVTLKLASICALLLLLHIPLAMTRGVLRERQQYQAEATDAIASVWGREQRITGPVLAVPYGYETTVFRSKVVNGRAVQVEEVEIATATAYFLPEELSVNGELGPEVRHRGIYDTVVYTAKMGLAGWFKPDFAAADIRAARIDWAKAYVLFGVSDLRGLRMVSSLKIGTTEAAFESSEGTAAAFLPLLAKVSGLEPGTRVEFAFDATVQGSQGVELAPLGKTTRASLKSSWADPSFRGAALPSRREVDEEGFTAEWESSHFSRGFPQTWTTQTIANDDVVAKIGAASFGVSLAQPVTGYSMVERAQKYGLLFFVLIFTVFFLFETTAALRIHPLQYALVGVALCLFFLSFLALSEFWPIASAYGASAALCTTMIALYAHSFLKTGWRTLVVAGGLGATYGYLYFVLKSQDYALLAGTAALFAGVALVMFFTRRVDWFAEGGAVRDGAR